MEIHIDDSEVHALARDINRRTGQFPRRVQTVVDKGGHDMHAYAVARAPVDTGFLKGSITLDITGLGFVLGPTAEYGGYVELGVPHPYVIHAKPGGTLAFPGGGGGTVFAKSVVHPPQAPQPYLGPAFDAVLPLIERALGQIGGEVVSR